MSTEKATEDISAREPPPKDADLPLAPDEKPSRKTKLASSATNSESSRSFEEQVKHYERRIRAHQKAKDRDSEGDVLSNLGILYYKASKYFDARTCHERHLNLAKLSENKRAEKRAYCNLGCTYRRIGNLDRAIECYEEGLRLVKELKDKHGEAKLLNNLGNILEQRNDFDQAVYYHQQRLQVAKEINDLDGESKACASLGNIYHLLGNIRESINYYEKLVACLKYKLAKQEKKAKGEEYSSSESTTQPHGSPCNSGEFSKLATKNEGGKKSNSMKNSGKFKPATSETNKPIGGSFGILSNGEEFTECI